MFDLCEFVDRDLTVVVEALKGDFVQRQNKMRDEINALVAQVAFLQEHISTLMSDTDEEQEHSRVIMEHTKVIKERRSTLSRMKLVKDSYVRPYCVENVCPSDCRKGKKNTCWARQSACLLLVEKMLKRGLIGAEDVSGPVFQLLAYRYVNTFYASCSGFVVHRGVIKITLHGEVIEHPLIKDAKKELVRNRGRECLLRRKKRKSG